MTAIALPERYTGVVGIGHGGMGEIYRATDTTLGRPVAIKVLDARAAADPAIRERFTREALAVARLSGNPHIVAIYDVGERDERPFIVMEYLSGGSLAERLTREGAQPAATALDWLEQAASALDAAHREGIVHRDVKPANLLFDRQGRVHVADFGVASAAGLGSVTQTGTVLGTASYLSPEQAMGERATPASDLYALAVVAFELLTGRRPFEAESVTAVAAAHVTAEVPSVTQFDPSLPRELDTVFARALAKHPSERYGSCGELVAALRAALDEAAGATSVIARPAPAVRTARPAWLVPLGALLLLALAGAAIAFAVTRGGGSTAAPTAPPPVRVKTAVKTVTQQATTVISTVVTTAPPATTAAPPTTAAAPSVGGDPYDENNRAYELMQAGEYDAALPLLEDAVQQLSGRGDLGTAYANYNLGYTLIQLGRCADAVPYLETSRSIQPQRREVKDALKEARGCSG
jgi:serine/threonine-protein kinase